MITEPPQSATRSPVTVLVVDDDRVVLETTAALLEADFKVLTAPGGSEALDVLAREHVQVVCTDYDMPGIDGVSLLRRARDLFPGVAGILVTGLREQLPAGILRDEAVFAIVYKPYAPDSLIRSIVDASKVAAMTRTVSRFSASTRRLNRDKGGSDR